MIKAYASYFASFLLNEIKDLSNINKIILFGSVARGEAGKESDVDIFIETKNNKKIELEIRKILDKFYKTREALLFKTKGIDNKINLLIGKIEDWPKLKKSIESSGILLYGPYSASDKNGKKYVIISWDKIERNRGAFLNKIYGFKVKDKSYKGLIEVLKGKKIGKSTLMLPIEYREQIFKLLKKYGVSAKSMEVYM